MKKKKHIKDKFFEDKVLVEALADLNSYGIKIDINSTPIMETWLFIWRKDFRFRNFIKAKMKEFNSNKKRRYIKIKKTRKINATVHIKLHKDIKKERSKIRHKIK